MHAALSLVATLFGVAVLFVAQDANFLAAVQVIVYAGAIVVLFLFVIMLLGVDQADDLAPSRSSASASPAVVLGVVLLGARLLFIVVPPRATGHRAPPRRTAASRRVNGQQRRAQLGGSLFTDYLLAVRDHLGAARDRRGRRGRRSPSGREPTSDRVDADDPADDARRATLAVEERSAVIARQLDRPTGTWCSPPCSSRIGAVGLLVRRNPLVMFMCVELMLNAVNLTFVPSPTSSTTSAARSIVFFVLVVAAAEVVVGLGIIVAIFRRRRRRHRRRHRPARRAERVSAVISSTSSGSIPALPLRRRSASCCSFGRRIGEPMAGWLATGVMVGCRSSRPSSMFFGLLQHARRASAPRRSTLFTWIPAGGFHVDIGFLRRPAVDHDGACSSPASAR